jgi:hypothetical protein
MLKIGDRVVDWQVETVFGEVYVGTVVGVGVRVVQVKWDCDGPDSHWVDTAYINELRLLDQEKV